MFPILKGCSAFAFSALLFCGACNSSGGAPSEPGPQRDASMPSDEDLAAPPDLAISSGGDLRSSGGDNDLALPPSSDLSAPPDLSPPADLTPLPDLAFPTEQGVDIYVDNTCKMDVMPKVFNVPRGVTLKLTYYNRSRYYPVEVWMSYGGGFTDLMPGMNWPERFEHCRFPRPYSAYADIKTACSSYRLMINCLN